MAGLRTVALKTQSAFVAAFLVVFALGAGVSQWTRSRSQAELVLSLHNELAIATKLPRMKVQLRRLDVVTAQYLQTGARVWLSERERALQDLQSTQADLARLFPEARERELLRELDRQLARHFKDEGIWIERRGAGRLSPEAAARYLAARRDYEDILEVVLGMHDVRLQDIPGRLRESDGDSRRWFFLVFLAGLFASGLTAFALSRYIIEPVSRLADYAAGWAPGQPWSCAAPTVSPEINGLYQSVRQLVERLNEESQKQRDLNQLKSRFVSLVSHELNNALSVINAASYSLEETDPDPADERRRRFYQMIQRQTRVLSTAVGNLLNAGRLESGKLALRRQRMEMADVLKSSLQLLEILAEEKGLKIALSLPEAPATVYADPDALTLVATNLLSNAIKYTPAGGRVSAIIAHEGVERKFVRVSIQDTGIGIAPEERERVFSGNYRSAAGQRLARGFGIGLSLAKSIIEAHGGRLELDSEPGKGSTFSFLLPLWREGQGGKENGDGRKAADRVGGGQQGLPGGRPRMAAAPV